jgi:GNAT superfamily N-acetyltransferase
MSPASPPPSARYLAALRESAELLLGEPVRPGTMVVVDRDRAGTGTATCYPTPGASIVWCDADVAERLSSVASSSPLSAAEFVAAAERLGAQLVGYGHNRVLDAAPRRPDADADELVVRHVTGDKAIDKAIDEAIGGNVGAIEPIGEEVISMLAALIADCDPDDVDEADLDLDQLDPAITLLVASDGTIAAYASGRPHELDPLLDDVAVLTHPEWRGRRLGALAVYEFVRRRQSEGRRLLYRCNVDNVASNRVAETLGFTLSTTIGAVEFPTE